MKQLIGSNQISYFPEEKEKIVIADYEFTILEAKPTRVLKVLIKKLEADETTKIGQDEES